MTHFGLGPRYICLWMLWLEGLSLNPWRSLLLAFDAYKREGQNSNFLDVSRGWPITNEGSYKKGPRGKRPDILSLLELFTYNFTLTRSKFPKEWMNVLKMVKSVALSWLTWLTWENWLRVLWSGTVQYAKTIDQTFIYLYGIWIY